jgi:sporulation protein YlmC with PRC-barrel domain
VKFCGFFCHGEDFVIPWDRICQIGNDIILVEIPEKEKKQP